MKESITAALGRLRGEPLWAAGRAGIVWFQFGSPRIVPAFRGGTKEVGEFALHLGCPWRLIAPGGDLLASDESELEVLVGLASPPLFCSGLRVGTDGAFELEFTGGERLVVEPDDPSCEEHWRLFRPGSEEPHFVVGASGIESTE